MLNQNHKLGLILCAKYAVAPNLFGYCGPDENKDIIDHLKDNVADKELAYLLSDFETLYPYLQLIAKSNKIEDYFDEKVVEAYWLGNPLLSRVKSGNYMSFLDEKLRISKKLDKENLGELKDKINNSHFLPNHSFHVFNIFKNVSKDLSSQTIRTMDECRIGFGRVSKLIQSVSDNNKKIHIVRVSTTTLIFSGGRLQYGPAITKEINIDYRGKQFVRNVRVGDWVSFHWGMICDILTIEQTKNLNFYTQKAMDFYNL